MKKNYSQNILKHPTVVISPPVNQSREKPRATQSPVKKVFQRKPVQGNQPLSRKRADQPASEVDSTMEQTTLSGTVEKIKNLRFVSCRSQTSLNSSIISRSSGALSFAHSMTDSMDGGTGSSRILPDQSIIHESPSKESKGQELFRRKTVLNVRTLGMNKKRVDDDSGTMSMMTSKMSRKMDEVETKLESSDLSDLSKSFCTPAAFIMGKNIVQNSKNSSKQSLRKSSSSNSLRKKQPSNYCQDCECNRKELKQTITKNERLQRIIKNKDQQISNLNRRIQEVERRSRELEKKVKEIERSDLATKVKNLEQQLSDSQEECLMLRNAYNTTLEDLKYKTVENTTMKKYQAQCQSVERKMQMLVTERNELRHRLSNVNVSSKSSYTNYPSSLSRSSKSIVINNVQNWVVPKSPFHKNNDKKRQTYTSRNQDDQDEKFYQEQVPNKNLAHTLNGGFKKKQTYNRCYDESSDSQIISLSEESNL